MKKKTAKGKSARARAIKDLRVSDARPVKGGTKGTPNLMTACASGQHIKEATITQ